MGPGTPKPQRLKNREGGGGNTSLTKKFSVFSNPNESVRTTNNSQEKKEILSRLLNAVKEGKETSSSSKITSNGVIIPSLPLKTLSSSQRVPGREVSNTLKSNSGFFFFFFNNLNYLICF